MKNKTCKRDGRDVLNTSSGPPFSTPKMKKRHRWGEKDKKRDSAH